MNEQVLADVSDELLQRLQRFHADCFPLHQQRFQDLVAQEQHPKTLFIGCSDSRLVPCLLTGTGPGELFIVRNVGALVPPYDGSHGLHGTMAGIEFAVRQLHVQRIIVCGHSHCGAIRTAYCDWRARGVCVRCAAWRFCASTGVVAQRRRAVSTLC